MDQCTEISSLCRVESTVLGYYPNLGAGIFFTVAFGTCLLAALPLGISKKTWTYTTAMTIGLVLETAGCIGRILLHYNPWNQSAFELQICAIILAPTFICVSIYLTLKHVALHLNPRLSRIPPRWYPRLFLPADLSCLIVQAIGGAIAAAAGHTNPRLQRDGNRAIIAGVVLQVLVLAVFGLMGADYLLSAARHMRGNDVVTAHELSLWRDPKFKKFVSGVTGAYAAVLIRCVYRIAEMAGGWGNKIMQDEPSFLVLDSSLILVAVYLLTIFHPGIFFPQMASGSCQRNDAAAVSDAESPEAKTNDAPDSSNEGPKDGV
ncbi:hypothetical protein ED733_004246 [Metarhizium rileyi]|uniref:RTA-like protein n=1 Tax=Metarhizium rileyi (strain RCEF 4871) TaxID=1649241 RepID=A0A5C6G4M3_METRR|nr:hypothetical protein ED733_004246 [Metarhizium rileyi]